MNFGLKEAWFAIPSSHQKNQATLIHLFCDAGIDPNITKLNQEGDTWSEPSDPLLSDVICFDSRNKELIQALLERGANPNIPPHQGGFSILEHFLMGRGEDLSVFDLLLDAHINLHYQSETDRENQELPPVLWMAQYNPKFIPVLVQKQAIQVGEKWDFIGQQESLLYWVVKGKQNLLLDDDGVFEVYPEKTQAFEEASSALIEASEGHLEEKVITLNRTLSQPILFSAITSCDFVSHPYFVIVKS